MQLPPVPPCMGIPAHLCFFIAHRGNPAPLCQWPMAPGHPPACHGVTARGDTALSPSLVPRAAGDDKVSADGAQWESPMGPERASSSSARAPRRLQAPNSQRDKPFMSNSTPPLVESALLKGKSWVSPCPAQGWGQGQCPHSRAAQPAQHFPPQRLNQGPHRERTGIFIWD